MNNNYSRIIEELKKLGEIEEIPHGLLDKVEDEVLLAALINYWIKGGEVPTPINRLNEICNEKHIPQPISQFLYSYYHHDDLKRYVGFAKDEITPKPALIELVQGYKECKRAELLREFLDGGEN